MIVGYNDLSHQFPHNGQIATLQYGEYWDFTCTRKLTGEVNGTAAVDGTSENTEKNGTNADTEFNMDIMCCDPEEKNCEQVSTLTMIPSIYLCFSVLLALSLSFV